MEKLNDKKSIAEILGGFRYVRPEIRTVTDDDEDERAFLLLQQRRPMLKHFYLLMLFAGISLTGCPANIAPGHHADTTMVLIDTLTKETYEHPIVNTFPVTNPITGNATLMPALYCPICEKWYAMPPLEETQRNPHATKCPIHHSQLVTTGKAPDHPWLKTQP